MSVFQLYSDYNFYNCEDNVYDLIFSIVKLKPTIDTNFYLVTYIFVFFFFFLLQSKKNMELIWKEMFKLLAMSMIIRTITISATSFQPSNDTCVINSYPFHECFYYAPLRMLGIINTCTDKIYSGHMSASTLLLCSWFRHFNKFNFIPVCFTLLVMFSSILERKHYTVDMVVSFIINFLLYEYAKNPNILYQ